MGLRSNALWCETVGGLDDIPAKHFSAIDITRGDRVQRTRVAFPFQDYGATVGGDRRALGRLHRGLVTQFVISYAIGESQAANAGSQFDGINTAVLATLNDAIASLLDLDFFRGTAGGHATQFIAEILLNRICGRVGHKSVLTL